MQTARNLAFLVLCIVGVVAYQRPAHARVDACSYDGYWSGNHHGSCPWEVGCQDGMLLAIEKCSEWYGYYGYVQHYECVEPLEPPTDFEFRCEIWPYD